MSADRHVNAVLVGVIASAVVFSAASSRPWKPTAIQMAADYATIVDNKRLGDILNLRWWASPTVKAGTALAAIAEKYVVISAVHWHAGPGGTPAFDDIGTLEVRDANGKPLVPVARNTLPPTTIGLLSTIEAGLRQSVGPIGERTKFFIFDAGTVRACEKGRISIPLEGEIYTWETPFPGCPQERTRSGQGADAAQ